MKIAGWVVFVIACVYRNSRYQIEKQILKPEGDWAGALIAKDRQLHRFVPVKTRDLLTPYPGKDLCHVRR